MKFAKVHGLGNDFVIINCMDEATAIGPDAYASVAIKLCDRHFGIGADGILLVLPSKEADICMRIINSDGSEAEMCGNGIRCFARYVYETGIVKKEVMTIETLAGIKIPRIILDAQQQVAAVEVDMGTPILQKPEIPMVGQGRLLPSPFRSRIRPLPLRRSAWAIPTVLFLWMMPETSPSNTGARALKKASISLARPMWSLCRY